MKSLYSLLFASLAAVMAFITPTQAQPAAPEGGGFSSLIPLLLIMVIFYFLLIRPQQKKVKEHRETVEALKKGDKVLTGGGIFATITDVQENMLTVKISDGVTIKVKKDTVTGLVEKTAAKEKPVKDKQVKEKKSTKKPAK
jgi:preprotein translocase subunit YajC